MPIGAAILALGYLMMAMPTDNLCFLYGALGVIVVGNGLFKANSPRTWCAASTKATTRRSTAAFTLYYMAVNVGSTSRMLLTPWVERQLGLARGLRASAAPA